MLFTNNRLIAFVLRHPFLLGATTTAIPHYLYASYNRLATEADGVTIGYIEKFEEPSKFSSGEICVSAPAHRDFVLFDELQVSRPFAKFRFDPANLDENMKAIVESARTSGKKVRVTHRPQSSWLSLFSFKDGAAIKVELEEECQKNERNETTLESPPVLPKGYKKVIGHVDSCTTANLLHSGNMVIESPGAADIDPFGRQVKDFPRVDLDPSGLTAEDKIKLEKARKSGEQVEVTYKPYEMSLFRNGKATSIEFVKNPSQKR